MESYRFGQAVEWTTKVEDAAPIERSGIIVVVVPAGKSPLENAPKGYSLKNLDATGLRDHESYLVVAGSGLFWPAVGKLRKVE